MQLDNSYKVAHKAGHACGCSACQQKAITLCVQGAPSDAADAVLSVVMAEYPSDSGSSMGIGPYHMVVLQDCMDEGRRRGMLCHEAAVLYHMPPMTKWWQLLIPPCQKLTQLMAAADSGSFEARCM